MNNLQLLPADTDAATQAAHLAEMMRLHSEIRKAVVMAAARVQTGHCRLGEERCRCHGRTLSEFMDNGCEDFVAA